MVSANVLTLDPSHAQRSYNSITGLTMLSKVALLKGMAVQVEVDIMGIQEGREAMES